MHQDKFRGPYRILFTSFLVVVGFGLLMAFAQILLTHGMADGKLGLSVDDIVYSYYGNRGNSRLEAKLVGSMKDKANAAERSEIVRWIRSGGSEQEWNSKIQPIFQNRCVMCHSSAQATFPAFETYAQVKPIIEIDKGATVESLARFSHIHLFGIAFIYFFICYIFALCRGLNPWFQGLCIVAPFAFLLLDFASWWLTKWYPGFAYMTIIAGTGNVIASAIMVNLSLYQMWISEIKFNDIKISLAKE